MKVTHTTYSLHHHHVDSNFHPHHTIHHQIFNIILSLNQQQLHWEHLTEYFLQGKRFLCHALISTMHLKIAPPRAKNQNFKTNCVWFEREITPFPVPGEVFIIWLECNNTVHLAVSEVCHWYLRVRLITWFVSSTEELPSNTPLLMSGFVRCSQEVKFKK